jgi:electron transport complex protein RnfD
LEQFLVETSPHIRAPQDVRRVMWTVVGALIPAGVAAGIFFGYWAIRLVAVCVLVSVATEVIIQFLRRKDITIRDGSAVVTGILLAYVLPPNSSILVGAVGSFIAIAIGKQAFGGLGHNIWNPALVGRAFVQMGYASKVSLSQWPVLKEIGHFSADVRGVDAVSRASALAVDFAKGDYTIGELFLGRIPGSIGETSALALLIGGVVLIALKIINWRMPLSYIGTVFALTWVLPSRFTGWFGGMPLYHIFAGGLMLGAFYMATDMVTTPITNRGIVVFGVGAGVLTTAIRYYGGYPEGVCYAILLMNTATPVIDRYARPRVFGAKR